MRALLTPRWASLLVAALVVVGLCLVAARWQWQRYQDAGARNAALDAARTGPATPVDRILQAGSSAADTAEYRLVEARGTYDPTHGLVVRLRTRDGTPGSEQLVPLRTASGAALLVDRGWYADQSTPTTRPPLPPSGVVTVRAWLQLPESGRGSGGDPASGAIRYLDVDALRGFYPYPVFGAVGQLVSEDPRPADAPILPERPTFTEALHLAYALQWVLFALLAVGGTVFLARTEVRGGRRPARSLRG